MIINPEITAAYLPSFLDKYLFPIVSPREIVIMLIKKVKIVVSIIFSPAILAPIPSPMLFKASAIASEKDSFRSMLPEVSLSAFSGLERMSSIFDRLLFSVVLDDFLFSLNSLMIAQRPIKIRMLPPRILVNLLGTKAAIKFPSSIDITVPIDEIIAISKLIDKFILIFFMP